MPGRTAPQKSAARVPLFPQLSTEAGRALALLPEALSRVRPLNLSRRRSLPEDTASLSRLLTVERGELRRPYWSSPAFVSAYLYYFLPWNLLRLVPLLTALPLPDPHRAAPAGGEALLRDAVSGPLTLPLALWLARPEWGDAPVRILALDSASQPLDLGRKLFAALGEMLGRKIWPVLTAASPVEQLARRAAPAFSGGRVRPWLVTAANVLNELHCGRRASDFARSGDGVPSRYGAERFENLLEVLSPLLSLQRRAEGAGTATSRPDAAPALLVVEPGTRLGGKTVMRLRATALAGGFAALAPCPHSSACPLLAGDGGRTWCHFTFGSGGAPEWLRRLSAAAGLDKKALSLSALLLRQAGGLRQEAGSAGRARVLSAPFAVPGLAGRARYACADGGLLLLEDAEGLACGDLIHARVSPDAPRDAKSRARIVRRASLLY